MKSIDDLLSLSHSKALLLAGVLVSSLICLQLSVDDSHSQWLVLKNSYFAKLTIPISYFSTFPSAYNQTFPPRAVPLVISYYHNPWEDDIVLFSQGFLNSAANYCSAQLDGQHVLYPISEKTTYAFRCAVPHADFGPLNNTVISLQLKDTTILDSAVRFVTPRLIRRGPPPLPKRSVCAVTYELHRSRLIWESINLSRELLLDNLRILPQISATGFLIITKSGYHISIFTTTTAQTSPPKSLILYHMPSGYFGRFTNHSNRVLHTGHCSRPTFVTGLCFWMWTSTSFPPRPQIQIRIT